SGGVAIDYVILLLSVVFLFSEAQLPPRIIIGTGDFHVDPFDQGSIPQASGIDVEIIFDYRKDLEPLVQLEREGRVVEFAFDDLLDVGFGCHVVRIKVVAGEPRAGTNSKQAEPPDEVAPRRI